MPDDAVTFEKVADPGEVTFEKVESPDTAEKPSSNPLTNYMTDVRARQSAGIAAMEDAYMRPGGATPDAAQKAAETDPMHAVVAPFEWMGGFGEWAASPILGAGDTIIGRPAENLSGGRISRTAGGDILSMAAGPVGDEMATARAAGKIAPPPGYMPKPIPPAPPSATQQLIEDFTKSGIDPNLATVSKSIPVKLGSHVLQSVPLASGRIVEGVDKMLQQSGSAAERIAGQYGEAGTPEIAGKGVQEGIQSFAKSSDKSVMTPKEIIAAPTRASSFSTKSNVLYNEFDKQMPADREFMVPATLNALKGPVDRFPTNPELGKSITNSKLQSWFKVLEPKIEEVAPKYSNILDPNGKPMVLQAAQKLESGGNLTFGEMKELRSYVGRLLGEPGLVSDIPRADLKSVYGALSHDMLAAAHSVNPKAVAAFNRANAYYKAGIDRIDALESILGNKLSPEQVFRRVNAMATDSASANVGSLRALRKSLGDEEWGDVGSTIIRRMGEPSPGRAPVQGATAHFSPNDYVTNWNKLTPEAKDVLFGNGSARQDLDRLARVVSAEKDMARYANTSRSGSQAILAGHASAIGAGLATTPVTTMLSSAAYFGGARAVSEALMNPKFVRWLVKAPTAGVPTP